jgi:hypothetical protein
MTNENDIATMNTALTPYVYMTYDNIEDSSGKLIYHDLPPGLTEHTEFNENHALAHLLAEDKLMIGNNWWWKDWPEAAQATFSIHVLCNDVFAWGCADAEEMRYVDLEEVYEYYHKDPIWGTAVWCIQKRVEMPQKPVYKAIMEAGIWNLDTMGLKENDY